jgi:phage-related protein
MAEAVQKNSTYYYSAKKLMNLADDDIKYLTNTAISLGKSFPAVFEELRKATKEAADHFNLDFKVMSKDVLTLRKDITNFAHKTSAELATVVGKISQMGVELQDSMTVFNKFQTFEDAATTTAQLSQSFGMMIDSMQLLKAESPDQMLEMYRDAFLATGKSFQDMDRFNRSLLIQQTGLTEQAAQALFSAENAGKTYEELMAEADANDPTKKQLKAIEEMRDAIVELKQDLTTTFTSLFGEDGPIQKGLKNAFMMNPRLRSAFEGITNALNEVYKSFSFTSQSAISEIVGPAVKLINKLAKYLRGDFIKQAKEGVSGLFQVISGYVNAQPEQIQKGFDKVMNSFRPIMKFFLGIGTEVFKSILTSIIDGLPSLLKVVSDTLDEVISWTGSSKGTG